jgi:hypothetical protein
MNERPMLWTGLPGIGLVVLCCGGPLLVGAIGVSALLTWGTHFIWPAAGLVIVAVALVLYSRFRRTHAASERCDDPTGAPSRKP